MKKLSLLICAGAVFSTANLQAQDVLWAGSGASITVSENAKMYVKGGLVLEDKSSLTNKGTIQLTGKSANFTDRTSSAYSYGNGRFVFAGTGNQSVKSNNRFGIIEVDNRGLDLQSDVSATNWRLNNGVVNTHAYRAIATASDNDAISAGTNNERFSNSWINGNLRRYINTNTVEQYAFPVGDDRRVKLCLLNQPANDPLAGVQYIDAAFSRPQDTRLSAGISENGLQYSDLSRWGSWTLAPDASPRSGKFDLSVSLADFSGLNDNRFGLLNNANGAWAVPAGSSLPPDGSDGRTMMGGFARRNQLSGFGTYAIGIMAPVAVNSAVAVKVFPDPVTNNEFFVTLTNCELKGLRLFSTDGSEVPVSNVLMKNGQVKVSLPASFAKGTYTVQLLTDKGLRTAKVVVL